MTVTEMIMAWYSWWEYSIYKRKKLIEVGSLILFENVCLILRGFKAPDEPLMWPWCYLQWSKNSVSSLCKTVSAGL